MAHSIHFTMVMNAAEMNGQLGITDSNRQLLYKVRNDPQVTHVCRIPRHPGLGELLQIINVLEGSMTCFSSSITYCGSTCNY